MTSATYNGSMENFMQLLVEEILLFRLLWKLLYQYPKQDVINMFIDNVLFSELLINKNNKNIIRGLDLLEDFWNKQKEKDSNQIIGDLRLDFTRLFIGPTRVLAPPWESVYFSNDRLLFTEQTQQVRDWFRRFGLEAEKIHNEPDDHIGLELAFLAHLAILGIDAHDKQDKNNLSLALEAQRQFLIEHPLMWVRLWSELVNENAQTDFYRGIALLTWGYLEELADKLKIEKPQEVRLFP